MRKFFLRQYNPFSGALTLTVSVMLGSTLSSHAAEVPTGVTLADSSQQVLTVANGTEPKSLDPAYAEDSTSQQISTELFEGLVRVDPQNRVHPGIARSWEISKDGLVYTFHLREDARWSDGSPLLADDVVYGFRRSVTPAVAAPMGYLIAQDFVKNAKAVMTGKMPPEALGVKAVDPHTIQITLSTTNPHFLNDLPNPVMFPIKASAVDKWGKKWSTPAHMISNGPYKLKEWVVNGHITLVRNEHYWNDKKTIINKVTFLPVQGMPAIDAYRAGRIDMTSADNVTLPLEVYRQFKKERPGELLSSPQMGIYYYDFNVNKPPFNDVRLRKALAYAVDRNIIAQQVTGTGQAPSLTFLPKGAAGYLAPEDPLFSLPRDKQIIEAKKLFKAAGYSKEHPLEFSLMYNTMDSHKKVALAIASMWNQIFEGAVKVRLENQEWKTFLDTRRQGHFQLARDGWFAGIDPSAFLDILMTDNAQNSTGWSDKTYDRLVLKADQEMNPAKRAKIYKQAQEILLRDMPVMPLYQYAHSVLFKPKVGGVMISSIYTPMIEDLYIKKEG